MSHADAFDSGYVAESEGLGFLDNPYGDYTTEARCWVDGYVQSMLDRREVGRGKQEHIPLA